MNQNNAQKRYFVFIGTKGWPKEAQAGDTVKLSLYEFLRAHPTTMLVKIDLREDCPNTVSMQGETTYEHQRYRVDINLHKIDVFNNSVVLTPHS